MYINFDMDAPFNHMRLVYHLVRTLCEIAIGKQVFAARGLETGSTETRDALVTAAVVLQREAIEWTAAMMRSVMDAAGTVHLIPVDSRTRKMSLLSLGKGGGSSSSMRTLFTPVDSSSLDVRAKQMTKQQLDAVRYNPLLEWLVAAWSLSHV